ncbi:MAG: hypothetical protein HOI66_16360 [Verrucomicrobia bacterium]|jgi:flagellar export protein FliJ|nr:hypothetical protein [Verrucomicrobiota bacterium]
MKRFQFQLENILNLRKHDENTVLSKYAEAVANLSKSKVQALSLKKRLTDEWRLHQEKLRDSGSSQSMIQQQQGWSFIETQINEAEEAIITAENTVEQLAGQLRERRQERESLESYREDGKRAHILEVDRLEQIELDELAGRGISKRY